MKGLYLFGLCALKWLDSANVYQCATTVFSAIVMVKKKIVVTATLLNINAQQYLFFLEKVNYLLSSLHFKLFMWQQGVKVPIQCSSVSM